MDPFVSAFPVSLASDGQVLSRVIPPARFRHAEPFQVDVRGETVTIPYRLYNDEPGDDARNRLSPTQQTMLSCLYTRHHDGLVRQRHLEQIIGVWEPWVIPFIVQLVGEYVVEIQIAIQQGLGDLENPGTTQHDAYGQFLAANPDFLTLTSQRVTSYWNCYYRAEYPRQDYPGRIVLDALHAAASSASCHDRFRGSRNSRWR